MKEIRENIPLIILWGLLAIPISAISFPLHPDIGIPLGFGIWLISVLLIAVALTDELINKE